jgi:RNA polymerase-binding transcription factor DksA
LFSKDLFKNKLPEEKQQLERDYQRKLNDLKNSNKKLVEQARQRIQAEQELKLKGEKERMLAEALG